MLNRHLSLVLVDLKRLLQRLANVLLEACIFESKKEKKTAEASVDQEQPVNLLRSSPLP